MSDAILILDPKIPQKSGEIIPIVYRGANVSNYKKVIANPVSNSGISVVMKCSRGQYMSRYVVAHFKGTATITTSGTLNPNNADFRVALRPMPIHSCITNATATLAGGVIAQQNLNRYMSSVFPKIAQTLKFKNTTESGTETMCDRLTQYWDYAGLPNSPFAQQLGIASGGEIPRTSSITNVTYPSATTMTITFDIYEPLAFGPFVTSTTEKSAFYDCGDVQIDLQFGDLSRMICISVPPTNANPTNGTAPNANSITSVDVTFVGGAQELLYNVFTTQTDKIPQQLIDADLVRNGYKYISPVIQVQSNDVMTAMPYNAVAGTQYEAQSILASPSTNPRLVVCWVTPLWSSLLYNNKTGPQIPDFSFRIVSALVSYASVDTILSGADIMSLYNLSVASGLTDTTFRQWASSASYQTAGAGVLPQCIFGSSILVLDMGKIGGLPPYVVPNAPNDKTSTLQVTLRIQNQCGDTVTMAGAGAGNNANGFLGFTVNLMTVHDSAFIIGGPSSSTTIQSIVKNKDIETARPLPQNLNIEVGKSNADSTLAGGSFSDFLDGFKSVVSPALDVAKMVGLGGAQVSATDRLLGGAKMNV